MNVEVGRGQINKKYGTKFNILVTCYSQLMAVAYGACAKEAGLDGNIVSPRPKRLWSRSNQAVSSCVSTRPANAGLVFCFPAYLCVGMCPVRACP